MRITAAILAVIASAGVVAGCARVGLGPASGGPLDIDLGGYYWQDSFEEGETFHDGITLIGFTRDVGEVTIEEIRPVGLHGVEVIDVRIASTDRPLLAATLWRGEPELDGQTLDLSPLPYAVDSGAVMASRMRSLEAVLSFRALGTGLAWMEAVDIVYTAEERRYTDRLTNQFIACVGLTEEVCKVETESQENELLPPLDGG